MPEPKTVFLLCPLVGALFTLRRRNPAGNAAPDANSCSELSTKQLTKIQMGKMQGAAWSVVPWCFLLILSFASSAAADVAPNPLQTAYWRFEEGPLFSTVNSSATDPVLDSINQNHLDAFKPFSEPTYTSGVPSTPLKSGAPNNFALDFIPHNDDPNTPDVIDPGGDDLFTQYNTGDFGKGAAKSINDGIIAAGGGFTIEASFTSNLPAAFRAIVGKEARPQGSRPLQTFVLKTYGFDDTNKGKVFAEFFDGAGNGKQLFTTSAILTGQWYSVAVVDNGTTASLYLNSHNGSGYVLQQSVAVSGALFQGNPANPLWDAAWTVGRGQFAGNPADWWDGMIDEVRISNTALSPSQFVFAPAGPGSGSSIPEPSAALLVAVAAYVLTLTGNRIRR